MENEQTSSFIPLGDLLRELLPDHKQNRFDNAYYLQTMVQSLESAYFPDDDLIFKSMIDRLSLDSLVAVVLDGVADEIINNLPSDLHGNNLLKAAKAKYTPEQMKRSLVMSATLREIDNLESQKSNYEILGRPIPQKSSDDLYPSFKSIDEFNQRLNKLARLKSGLTTKLGPPVAPASS